MSDKFKIFVLLSVSFVLSYTKASYELKDELKHRKK